ncbi:MAG: thiamine phosphate synthase [Polyangiaceae bacterium]
MSLFDELRLVAITDLQQVPAELSIERWQRLAHAARPRTVAVDLRAPNQPARDLLQLGARLRDIAHAAGQLFIAHERLDIASLLAADALHLREDSVPSEAARRLLPHVPILRACHSVDDLSALDADAALLSPILEARKGNPALGLDALRAARTAGKLVFALGGVDAERAAACLQAGARGVAAIGSALGSENPEALLRGLDLLKSR